MGFSILAIAVAFVVFDIDIDDLGSTFSSSQGLKTNDVNGGTFSSTGSMYALSFTNYFFQCAVDSELRILVNGQWKLVSSDSDLFSTLIGADIQHRTTSETISDWRVDNFVSCDYSDPAIQHLKVSGDTTLGIFSGQLGNDFVTSKKVPISSTTLQDNVRTKVSQIQFKSSDIENSLTIGNNGQSWVYAITNVNGQYTLTFNEGTVIQSHATGSDGAAPLSTLQYLVKVIDTIAEEDIIQDANRQNSVIFIEDIIQVKTNTSVKGKTMDLNNGQQIKIKATMRDYVDTDGLPTLKITGPNVSVTINMPLKSITNDNDGQFENNFLLPRDSVGQWSFKFDHAFRSGSSSGTVTTIDSGVTTVTNPTTGTTTTTNEEGQIILTGGTTGGTTDNPISDTETRTAITKMHYINRYDQVPDCNISTGQCTLKTKTVTGVGESKSLQLNSLTDSISFSGQTNVEALLDEVQITTVVSADFDVLKDIKRATKSDTIYQATLSPAGDTAFSFTPFHISSPQPNICYGSTSDSAICVGMQLDIITISNEKMESELAKKNIEPEGQKVKLTVTAIDGTFTLLDKNNRELLGSAKGTSLEYTFTYGATSVNTGSNTGSSSQSCSSSDPSVGCDCPEGQVLTFSTNLNKLACVDPTTGNETPSQPTSDPNTESEPEFVDNGIVEPHCEVDSNGNVIATFGNVSIDDPNCAALFGEVDTTGDNGQIEGDPEEEVTGSGSEQPVFDCKDQFGVDVCAFASNPAAAFSDNGLQGEDGELNMTVVGVLLGIILIIIAIAVALRKRARGY